MFPSLLAHHLHGGSVLEWRLVDPAGNQCVINIGDRHQSASERNLVPDESARITLAIPAFVMGQCNLPSVTEEAGVAFTDLLFCGGNGIGPELRMLLHDSPFLGCQLAGLQQNVIRNGHFADVVQRGGLEDQRNVGLRQFCRKARVRRQLFAECQHIVLCAEHVVAGFVVARLDQ